MLETCRSVIVQYGVDYHLEKVKRERFEHQEVFILILKHVNILRSEDLLLVLDLSEHSFLANLTVSQLKDPPLVLKFVFMCSWFEVHVDKREIGLLEAMCETMLGLSYPRYCSRSSELYEGYPFVLKDVWLSHSKGVVSIILFDHVYQIFILDVILCLYHILKLLQKSEEQWFLLT